LIFNALQKSYEKGQKKSIKKEQRIEKMSTFAPLLINRLFYRFKKQRK